MIHASLLRTPPPHLLHYFPDSLIHASRVFARRLLISSTIFQIHVCSGFAANSFLYVWFIFRGKSHLRWLRYFFDHFVCSVIVYGMEILTTPITYVCHHELFRHFLWTNQELSLHSPIFREPKCALKFAYFLAACELTLTFIIIGSVQIWVSSIRCLLPSFMAYKLLPLLTS